MNQEQIDFSERTNHGSSPTGHEEFDKNGCLFVKDIVNSDDLYCDVPYYRGSITYGGKLNKFNYDPEELQVLGSVARYYYPPYKYIHAEVGKKIGDIIGKKLYRTYYYDRFYFPGQELTKHTDRDACEISVTINVSTNLKKKWPIFVKTPNTYADENDDRLEITEKGKELSFVTNPGDGVIYKGCERPHWRESMPSNYRSDGIRGYLNKLTDFDDDTYYHQIFFHYVLADGNRSHFANDVK